jgi:hypothetical protein
VSVKWQKDGGETLQEIMWGRIKGHVNEWMDELEMNGCDCDVHMLRKWNI